MAERSNSPAGSLNRALAWFVLLVMGLTWGLSFSLARIVTTAGVHPLGLVFWETWIAGLALLAFIQLSRRQSLPVRSLAPLYVTTGLLGMVIPGSGFFYAAPHLPAGVLSISVAVVPITTFVASAALGFERFEALRIAGLILGAVAVILLVGPSDSLPDPNQLGWVVVAFATSASYAVLAIVLTIWNPPGNNPLTSTCGMFLFAGLIMIPVVVATHSFAPFGWPWGRVEWSMFGLGAINAVAYALYFFLVDRTGPVFSSQTANVVTLFGVAWGMLLFSEQHSLWVWLSFATMMVALVLVRPRKAST